MPMFSIIFLFFTLANMSLLGTSSFIEEFLILVGAFQRNSLVTTLVALGMILNVAYSLWLYNRVIFENFCLTIYIMLVYTLWHFRYGKRRIMETQIFHHAKI
jgi:NADH:ubiquinone oxidoreductase subunit 4 (subunit M)